MPVRRVNGRRSAGWETSPGGLVAALHPMLRDRGGAWIGWDGAIDAPATDAFEHENIRIRPIALSSADHERFYSGFSNRTLWPLYHDSIREPRFHRRWWSSYIGVNRRFADAASDSAGERDLIWVHDYQLQLAPGMIRDRRPWARIGFFLHTPFPSEQMFAKLPWRREILEGMLGADLIGFQTPRDARNFVRASRRFAGAGGRDRTLTFSGRTVEIGVFPVSIDVERYEAFARDPAIAESARAFRRALGDRRVVLGVDRLDYTKGIDIRLKAFDELLSRGRHSSAECVMVQVAVPTRESVDDYAELRDEVEALVEQVNGAHGSVDRPAVHYVFDSLTPEEVAARYAAADVMVVTPLRDGMNLVAKEFCMARGGGDGVLVLSEFAGAALELRKALLVNPFDIDGIAGAIGRGLEMDPVEQRRRMGALQRAIRGRTVHDWADGFIDRLRNGTTGELP